LDDVLKQETGDGKDHLGGKVFMTDPATTNLLILSTITKKKHPYMRGTSGTRPLDDVEPQQAGGGNETLREIVLTINPAAK